MVSDSLKRIWRKLNRATPGLFLDPSVASGHYAVYVKDGSERKLVLEKDNLLLYTWGVIAAHCIGLGAATHKISSGYIEFENSATAGTVVVPSYGRGDYTSYYTGLTGNKDFLRLSLDSTPTLDQHPDYVSLLPAGENNRVSFGLTGVGGTQGVKGKTFSSANQSVAYGIALVATPLFSDMSQDLILARGYFNSGDQVAVPLGGQVEVDWKISFK